MLKYEDFVKDAQQATDFGNFKKVLKSQIEGQKKQPKLKTETIKLCKICERSPENIKIQISPKSEETRQCKPTTEDMLEHWQDCHAFELSMLKAIKGEEQ